jgi:hypothetical protein
MPIRVPNLREHEALVAAFRHSLGEETSAQIVERLLNQESCFCIDAATRQMLSERIRTEFEFGAATFVVVGSAQLGFSTVAKPNRPRYRAFSVESDVDVAIVSSDFYDRVWEEVFLHFVENRPWPQVQEFQKYFFRGWIRPDKLPYNSAFRSRWFDYFRGLSRELFDSEHEIRCGLYKSQIFLTEYHKLSVKRCQDAEEIA